MVFVQYPLGSGFKLNIENELGGADLIVHDWVYTHKRFLNLPYLILVLRSSPSQLHAID